MRLSTRIALAVAVVVPLLVLASGWLMVRLVAHDVHAAADTHLRERASAVRTDARNLLRAMANDRPASVEQARQRRLFSAALDVGIRVTGPGGTVSGGPQPDASVALPAPAAAARPVTVDAGAQSWRALAVPVSVARPATSGTLWLFSTDTAGQAQITQVRRRVITVALLAAPVAGAAGWLAATRLALPLRRLQRSASGIDPRVSAARLEHTPTGVTEVDELAGTLRTVLARYDEQAARTAEALATARSFSAAASHELRTPLMSMRINLDVLDGTPEPGAVERAEITADLRAEHARLLGLLVMLRALAQGDLVEADAFGPVDLGDLLDTAVAGAGRAHPHARITVTAAPDTVMHGWLPGLRSAVDNLLANAALHGVSPDGTARVDVRLGPGDDPATVRLTIDDHGPGIPPDARPAVFRRFHRSPGSPGSGLGLTLLAQQIALHGGTVAIGEPPGHPGTRFTVTLPRTGGCGEPLPGRRDWLAGETGSAGRAAG
jgi:two-component system sensor histidine kinase PrrB